MFAKILVAYDGSSASEKALDSARRLLKMGACSKLEVLHVFQYPRLVFGEAMISAPAGIGQIQYDQSEAVITNARKSLEGMKDASVTWLQGPPAKTIVEYAEQSGCNLIIIGSRGLGSIGEFVLGSVSHNVIQHSKVPVLVVK